MHRRQFHRLGAGAGLRAHRFPHRRGRGRRALRGDQGARHRWPGQRTERRRTDALRDRRPTRLPAARRGLRLHRGAPAPGRTRPGRGGRRARPAAHRPVQGQRHLSGRFPLHRQLPDRRHRCAEEGRAGQPGDHRQDRGNLRRARLGALPRGQRRTARQRSHLWSPWATAGQPRSGGQAGRPASAQGSPGAVLPRDRPGRHRDGARPDRHRRRPADGVSGDPPVLFPDRQGAMRVERRDRRPAPSAGTAGPRSLRPGTIGRGAPAASRHARSSPPAPACRW